MTTGAPPPRVRTGTRRDDVARDAVLRSADDLVAERGYRRVTIEAIAARAGVSKQTIYRWWRSKSEVLIDTVVADAEKSVPLPLSIDATALRDHYRRWADFVSEDPAGSVLVALLAEAHNDPAVARVLRDRFLDRRRHDEFALLMRLGGSPDDRQRRADALDAFFGTLVYRSLIGESALLDPGSRDRLADALMAQLTDPGGSPPRPR